LPERPKNLRTSLQKKDAAKASGVHPAVCAASEPGHCPIDSFLRRLSGPWTTYILYLLGNADSLRFGELQRLIPNISPKILTERLKRLEADGLVFRDQQPTIPPIVRYWLTPRGVELKEILKALGEVALRWSEEDAARPASASAPALIRIRP
jgi:DNA-binding HxlR family transcriptional regulator